jgi:hypothetical protein
MRWWVIIEESSAAPIPACAFLKRIIETIGTTHIGLTFHFGGLSQHKVLKSMERFARLVMPALK